MSSAQFDPPMSCSPFFNVLGVERGWVAVVAAAANTVTVRHFLCQPLRVKLVNIMLRRQASPRRPVIVSRFARKLLRICNSKLPNNWCLWGF